MFSPHSSGDQSVLSEGSTITQTPTEKEDPSSGRYSHDLTPTKLPLTGESLTSIAEITTEDKPSALQKVCVDDLFDSTRQSLGQTLNSTDSSTRQSIENTSSTTGFEVGQLGAQKLSTMKESYDENDEEVAEVLGESYKEEAEEEEEEVEESLEVGGVQC